MILAMALEKSSVLHAMVVVKLKSAVGHMLEKVVVWNEPLQYNK